MCILNINVSLCREVKKVFVSFNQQTRLISNLPIPSFSSKQVHKSAMGERFKYLFLVFLFNSYKI